MTDSGSEIVNDFIVSIGLHGRCILVRLHGELDLATAPHLQARLDEAVRLLDPPMLVVDVGELSFCDSSGLSALTRTWSQVREGGGRMLFTGVQGRLTRLLTITGLIRRFETRPTIEQALEEIG